MHAMIKWVVVAGALAAGGCAVTGGPGYGGSYGGYPSGPAYPSPGYGNQGERFRCESEDGRQKYCTVDTRGGVSLVRQLSSTPCVRGTTWGTDRRGVWVSRGCRAEFATGYGNAGGDYPGGVLPGYPGGGQGQGTIRCESDDGRTRQCALNTAGGVRLVRQLSSTRCIEGRNWGYDRNAIWVSQGCRAEFQTGVGGGPGWGSGGSAGQLIRCESPGNRQQRCSVPVRGGVELVRQISSTRCVEGSNWGFDRNGIWVDRGCRAEFRVR